jgi:3-deoxy-D-manno-octulosonate 8-phosphate phosphatase (KDO 8-P phosphatase)
MALNDIQMIVFDVDGVLTDGSITIDDAGQETKRFFVRDGSGIAAALRVGLKVAVITGRSSRAVNHRIRELRIPYLLQGCLDKARGLETLCAEAGVQPEHCAYLGDDLVDLPAMLRCGYRMAVADAVAEVREEAHYTTTTPGGRGAAREAIEHIIKGQGKWEQVLERYGL